MRGGAGLKLRVSGREASALLGRTDEVEVVVEGPSVVVLVEVDGVASKNISSPGSGR